MNYKQTPSTSQFSKLTADTNLSEVLIFLTEEKLSSSGKLMRTCGSSQYIVLTFYVLANARNVFECGGSILCSVVDIFYYILLMVQSI